MNFLEKILEIKKEEVSDLRKIFSFNSFREMEFFNKKCLSFKKEVNNNKNISIIAEIKKASPSKGIINANFDHIKISEEYFSFGVNAVSVLTDKHFFQGDINFLYQIAHYKKAPLLRKDFIIDDFQIFEAKANGADMILLICEALSKNQIKDLSQTALECGLEVLLELHSDDQLIKIDFDINNIIGINNRNLIDFNVDLNITKNLANQIPEEIILVAESGIRTKEDINLFRSSGVDAILVGEYLMKNESIQSKLENLKNWCKNES